MLVVTDFRKMNSGNEAAVARLEVVMFTRDVLPMRYSVQDFEEQGIFK